MDRFLFWSGDGTVNASCQVCDFRMTWEIMVNGGQVYESCETHDCLRDN